MKNIKKQTNLKQSLPNAKEFIPREFGRELSNIDVEKVSLAEVNNKKDEKVHLCLDIGVGKQNDEKILE
jgi:hypothetical protein